MRGCTSGGACDTSAVSVVVTPLTLSKSLSVKTATRTSGRQSGDLRLQGGRARHQVEQQVFKAPPFWSETFVPPDGRVFEPATQQ